ncbi:hypothetical protein ACFX2I_013195 [Malus domestica]
MVGFTLFQDPSGFVHQHLAPSDAGGSRLDLGKLRSGGFLSNKEQERLWVVQAIPEDEGYRKAVESFTRHCLNVCCEEEDWDAIEKKLGCGQVEEFIEEAHDELTFIGKMIEWDPWGVLDDYECEVIENDAPIPKLVPLHQPGPLLEEFYKTLEGLTTN